MKQFVVLYVLVNELSLCSTVQLVFVLLHLILTRASLPRFGGLGLQHTLHERRDHRCTLVLHILRLKIDFLVLGCLLLAGGFAKEGELLLLEELGLLLRLLVKLFLLDDELLDLGELRNLRLVILYRCLVCQVLLTDVVGLVLQSVGQSDFEELWPHISFGFLHDIFVTQLGLDVFDTLYIGVCYLTILVTVTFFNLFGPLDAVELQVEFENENWVNEVDEGKALTALRLEILGQVEIVVLALELLVKELHHVRLAELDWNVPDHEGGLLFDLLILILLRIDNPLEINLIVFRSDENLLLVVRLLGTIGVILVIFCRLIAIKLVHLAVIVLGIVFCFGFCLLFCLKLEWAIWIFLLALIVVVSRRLDDEVLILLRESVCEGGRLIHHLLLTLVRVFFLLIDLILWLLTLKRRRCLLVLLVLLVLPLLLIDRLLVKVHRRRYEIGILLVHARRLRWRR